MSYQKPSHNTNITQGEKKKWTRKQGAPKCKGENKKEILGKLIACFNAISLNGLSSFNFFLIGNSKDFEQERETIGSMDLHDNTGSRPGSNWMEEERNKGKEQRKLWVGDQLVMQSS